MSVADVATGRPADPVRPWPGLDAFSEELQGLFFGRDAEAAELFRRVRRDTVTLFYGESGLGKTSLLQAGLFPRLRAAGFLPILVRLNYAEGASAPSAQVKAAIEREAAAVGAGATIAADDNLWAYFHRADSKFVDRAGGTLVPVLAFDQFEEMFTLGLARDEMRGACQSFLGELAELIEDRPPDSVATAIEHDPGVIDDYRFDRQDYRILIALREDFLAPLESLRARAPLIGRNRFRLRRMSGRQGFEAVTKPVPRLIEPESAREIVRFVGRANPEDAFGSDDGSDGFEVEPALLSLVCRELNERRLALGLDQITPDLLAGNRDNIIRAFYENALADQPQALREFVEDRLLSESGFRESVTLDSARRALAAAGVAPDALDALVRRRLLRIEERLDVTRVEIIHDVLARVTRESRDSHHLRQAQTAAAERERELRRARRRTKLAYGAVAAMALLLVATAVLGWMARQSSREAQREKGIAQHSLALATDTANGLVFDIVEKFRDFGMPAPIIKQILDQALTLQTQLAQGGHNSPDLEHSRAAALMETTDTLLTLGDTQGALAAATQARQIMTKLAAAAPGDLMWKRELSVADEKVGDVLQQRGDLVGAIARYRAQYALCKELTQKQPGNTMWQRDLSIADSNIGDGLEAQGDLAGALAVYRDGLAIRKRLTKEDPRNTGWQRDVSVSDADIGDVLKEQGHLPEALAAYRDGLAIAKGLAEKAPGNTLWQRDLSIADNKVGDVLEAQDRHQDALAKYNDGLGVITALTEKDPGNTVWQRDLAVSNERVGDVLEAEGDLAGALAHYHAERAIMVPLANKDPRNSDWQRFISIVDEKIGYALAEQGDLSGALDRYHEEVKIAERLARLDPTDVTLPRVVLYPTMQIGLIEVRQQDLAAARVSFEKAEKLALYLKKVNPTASQSTSDLSWVETQLDTTLRAIISQKIAAMDVPDALGAGQERVAMARREYAVAPGDAAVKSKLAIALGALSWTLVLDKRPQDALDAAQAARALDPSLLFVEVNRAHALLLLGHFDEAQAIYVEDKDKKLGNQTFAAVVRADFATMRKFGIDTPDMKRIEGSLAD